MSCYEQVIDILFCFMPRLGMKDPSSHENRLFLLIIMDRKCWAERVRNLGGWDGRGWGGGGQQE